MKKLLIPFDVFNRGIMILIGTIEELKNALVEEGFSEDGIDFTINLIKGLQSSSDCYTIKIDGSDVIIYSEKPFPLHTLVHESVHAITQTLDIIGAVDDEVRAYLTEYVYRQAADWLTSLDDAQ